MDKHIFVCDSSNEGILTAVYKAFSYRNNYGTDNIGIVIDDGYGYMKELFATYENVETDNRLAEKTLNTIEKKLGGEVYWQVLSSLCHFSTERGYDIYRYLERAFKIGSEIIYALQDEYVMKIMEYSRKVGNEQHLFIEFLRFSETNGYLCARIEPKCNVVPLIVNHFADRFPGENFIIYDPNRNLLAVHKAYGSMVLMHDDNLFVEGELKLPSDAELPSTIFHDQYEDLWQIFFDTIAIEERVNPRCQRNLLPLWYRKNMKEFKKDGH